MANPTRPVSALVLVCAAVTWALGACHDSTGPGPPDGPGSVLWRHAEARGSGNTPFADAELVVFMLFREPVVVALDAESGTPRWERRLPDPIGFGFPADGAPVAHGDLILVPAWDLFALDRRTGAIVWSFNPPDDHPATTGLLLHQGRLYTGGRKLYAIDPATGAVLWSRPLGDRIARPQASGDTIFATSGTLTPGSTWLGPGAIHALDAATGNILWERTIELLPPRPASFPSGPYAVTGTTLVVPLRDGRILGLRQADGALLWTYDTSTPEQTNRPTGGAAAFGSVVVTGGDKLEVEGLSLETGARIWSVALPGSVSAPITGADGIAYVVTGRVRAFDPLSGKLLWMQGDDYLASATVVGDRLYIGGETALWALRAGQ